MKKNWKLIDDQAHGEERFFPDLENSIEKILRLRNISTTEAMQEFFWPDYEENTHDPFLLSGMQQAVDRVLEAKKSGEKVCIYGDYDADGVTSSVLLKDILDQIEIENFSYIPERNKEGYGLNKEALSYVKSRGASLVITVDCGVTNVNEVEYANSLGLEVVILDHHHVLDEIPNAVAVINPKKKNDPYPEKELAGVGVAFKFAGALTSKIKGYSQEQLKWLLDLVSIGTVADCVPLTGENRTLVKFGLIVLGRTKRVGLRQLFKVGKIDIGDHNPPTSWNISFQIAPRINAAGRMDHANTAYNLLIAKPDQEAEARTLALELESQNGHRQKVTDEIVKEVEANLSQKPEIPKIIFQKSSHWELGVIGLASGRITEKYHRPSILLHELDGVSKGSGRSIKVFNLIEALEKAQSMLEKFGGHRQAAGLTIKNENLEKLRNFLEEECSKLTKEELARKTEIDVPIDFSEINEKLISQLNLFEPFGQENKKPLFLIENLEVAGIQIVGNGKKHLKLKLKEAGGDPGKVFDSIGFGLGDDPAYAVKIGDRLNVVGNLEEDGWNGRKKIQIKIIDFEKM